MTNAEIYRNVKGMLSDRIQDIYIDMQKSLDIKNGDCPIDYTISEELATERLAKMITETLVWQKGE